MWFANWEKAARCKKQREVKEDLAEECQLCQMNPPIAVTPWDAVTEDDKSEGNMSTREASPESWVWSGSSDSDGRIEETLDLVDEDTETSIVASIESDEKPPS